MFNFGMMNNLFNYSYGFGSMMSPFSFSAFSTPFFGLSPMNMCGFMPAFSSFSMPMFNMGMFDTFSYQGGGGSSKSSAKKNVDYSVTKLQEKWSKKAKGAAFNQDFFAAVVDACKELKCDPDDFMVMMFSESGFKYNTKMGLFGFCNGLDGRTMTPIQQVKAAKKYLMDGKIPAFGKDHQLTGAELYSLNFVPGTVLENRKKAKKTGQDPNEMALVDKNGPYWNKTNRALDYNNDGKVTTNEMQQRINKKKKELNLSG